MADLSRPRVEYRTPEDLVNEVLHGRLRIPPFQRGFKWEAGDVAKLFDSLVRGYPVGNLLLWQQPAPAQHLRIGPVEIEALELTQAEVFHALHSGMAGSAPLDLHSIGRVPAELAFGALADRLALRCVLAFQGGDIFRADFHQEFADNDDRRATFGAVAAALREVVEFLQAEAGIPHEKLLPYSLFVPVLVRFVRLHGAPEGRVATLLRRWIWRSAVASAVARDISVADVRAQVAAIAAASAVDAARDLLAKVRPHSPFSPELDKINLKQAMTKINVLGLLSASPRDLATGEPVDISHVLEMGSPLHMILPDQYFPAINTLANRVIGVGAGQRPVLNGLATATEDVAASHLVDAEAQALLRRGEFEEFLDRRAQLIGSAIAAHVQRMAEWGARDGRALADIVRSAA